MYLHLEVSDLCLVRKKEEKKTWGKVILTIFTA